MTVDFAGEDMNSKASNVSSNSNDLSRTPGHQQELIVVIRKWFPLLILGPIITAATVYVGLGLLPPKFWSVAYLRIDKNAARSLEAVVETPGLIDPILSKYSETGSTPEQRVKYIKKNLMLSDSDPQGARDAPRPFKFQVSSSIPAEAQNIAIDILTSWRATTVPGPDRIKNIGIELSRLGDNEVRLSSLLNRLQADATTLVMPNSLTGEIANPISDLIAKRDKIRETILSLEKELEGVSSDVIIAPPHLPVDASGPRTALTLLSFLAAIPGFLGLALFLHWSISRLRRTRDA